MMDRGVWIMAGILGVGSLACVKPAARPDQLVTERFEQKPWQANTFKTERGEVSYGGHGWISNVGLMSGAQVYQVQGSYRSSLYDVSFECRTQPGAMVEVAHALPKASYACTSLGEEPSRGFLIAFDEACLGGVLQTAHGRYRLGHWVHDRYGWHEGFKLYRPDGRVVGAISWSWGGEVFHGVHVDPSLPQFDRDVLAIARAALRAMRDGEEVGPICGTMRDGFTRIKPPPEA